MLHTFGVQVRLFDSGCKPHPCFWEVVRVYKDAGQQAQMAPDESDVPEVIRQN